MTNLFRIYEKEIEEYCIQNNLNFAVVKRSIKNCGKDDIWIQHIEGIKGKGVGAIDSTPAPITLVIKITESGLKFEQTPHTYLIAK